MGPLISGVYPVVDATQQELAHTISQAIKEGAESLWLAYSDHPASKIESFPDLASHISIQATAAVVPGYIIDSQFHSDGVLVVGFKFPLQAFVVQELSKGRDHIEKQIAKQLDENQQCGGALVIVDGTSPGIESLARSLYNQLGPDSPVLGGGAGFSDFHRAPCLATEQGIYRDAAVVVPLPYPLTSEARHGWTEAEGPYLVTHAEGNLVHHLNYRPALEVYFEAISNHLGYKVDEHNFGDISGSFPFGLRQLDSELLVRDPFALHGQSMECVGEVPEHSLVYILEGQNGNLVDAATQAATALSNKLLDNKLPNNKLEIASDTRRSKWIFMVDCISRSLHLGEEFSQELQAVNRSLPSDISVVGVLTLGEFVSSKQGPVHFLNKTIVLGGVEE